uniref:BH4_2 domain-containing protein n=1 Tax=Elaeophora elaphi TaxID=1147741 RepID=A0A0R3RP15_9BILA
VALPKYLRSNEQLILNLKQNSRRHTSHFDFYATLYDIARYARKDNFQKWDEHNFRSEFGEIRGGIRARSLLRPISYDRTCEEMEIPHEYCICEQTWHKSDIHSDDATKAAQLVIVYVNDFLKQKNLSGICETLDFIQKQACEWLLSNCGWEAFNGKYSQDIKLIRLNSAKLIYKKNFRPFVM